MGDAHTHTHKHIYIYIYVYVFAYLKSAWIAKQQQQQHNLNKGLCLCIICATVHHQCTTNSARPFRQRIHYTSSIQKHGHCTQQTSQFIYHFSSGLGFRGTLRGTSGVANHSVFYLQDACECWHVIWATTVAFILH